MNSNIKDSALASRLKTGDREAFTELYAAYSKRLYLNLVKLVKSESIAEEILQDIFVIIWEKRYEIDIRLSFQSYLFRIGENKVTDFFRKARRDKNLFAQVKRIASEQYSHIEEELLSRENSEFLKKAIDTLPPQRKQIFELCKLHGKSYNEVSILLGISTSTINDHIVKATKSIREFLCCNMRYSPSLLLFMVLKDL